VTSNVGNWTAGFFASEMWQMYSRTNDPTWKTDATTWTLPLSVDQTFTDDLTFRIFNAYYPMYEATGNAAYKQVIINAAASRVSTWNATVGAFSSVGVASHSGNPQADFGVLMDHMMDCSLVLWAAKQTGNKTWTAEALQHARTVAKDFFRANGSVYQWGYFDKATGKFVSGENYQGYSDSSAWARAQAWAIYSFSVVYRETGASDMLADARRAADYFIGHLPSDKIPYWDFNAPGIPTPFRDTSAAAIAASGLIMLSRLNTDATAASKYMTAGKSILTSLLSSTYLAKGTTSEGILQHGAWFVPPPENNGDASLVWGDYYLLEAMNEYMGMPHALPGT
jgi:unsaturated chondroitin disaccharide hydrolase